MCISSVSINNSLPIHIVNGVKFSCPMKISANNWHTLYLSIVRSLCDYTNELSYILLLPVQNSILTHYKWVEVLLCQLSTFLLFLVNLFGLYNRATVNAIHLNQYNVLTFNKQTVISTIISCLLCKCKIMSSCMYIMQDPSFNINRCLVFRKDKRGTQSLY